MPSDQEQVSIEVYPERDGTYSICIMDEGGEVLDAKIEMDLVAAIGTATQWADRHGVRYRVAGGPRHPEQN